MILQMGVRTTEPVKVAFRPLEPEESEVIAISELLSILTNQNPFYDDRFDHSMVVFYDYPNTSNQKRELMIPVQRPVRGVKTKVFPSKKVAFLVYKGTDTPMEDYYLLLQRYIEDSGFETSKEISRIEVMYVPEDVDEQDYTLEIMIPLIS